MKSKITMPEIRNGTTYSQPSIFLCTLLCCWILVNPVRGYSLKKCTVRESLNDTNMKVICGKKNLQAIPEDIPRKVRSLDLSINNIVMIKTFDFKDLSALKSLNMSCNRISHVDDGAFSDLVVLQELNLANNRLNTLSDHLFQGLGNLSVLRLDHNHIKTISSSTFQNLFSLNVLNLTGNQLYVLKKVQTVLLFTHLQELYIASNGFTFFQSQDISNKSIGLRVLDLSQNPMRIFRITADVLPKLHYLNLSDSGQNGSMTWDVPDRSFLSNMKSLNLSGVHMSLKEMSVVLQSLNSSLSSLILSHLGEDRITALANIACHITTLTTLRLRYNNMRVVSEELLKSCTYLTKLDISHNALTHLSHQSFSSMKQLTTLDLSNNRLSSVPNVTHNIQSLTILDLRYNTINKLGSFDFANLTGLTYLRLFHNQITDIKGIDFQDLQDLKLLDLGRNSIPSLRYVFKNCLQKLENLQLGGNMLRTIHKGDFESLQSLKTLILFDNRIDTVEDGAFQGLVNLKMLSLASNRMSQISIRATMFRGLTALERLDLSWNRIKYLHYGELKSPPFSLLPSLKILIVSAQHPFGMLNIPSNFLHGLTNLLAFSARSLNIKSFHPDTFNNTPQLWSLDISLNEFTALSKELFHPIPRLNRLYLSKAQLQSLDFLIGANLTQLSYLQVRKNDFTVVSETMIRSLPALVYLDLQDKTFTCDCSNAWFVQWVTTENQTQVVDAYDFTCNYPVNLGGTKLLDFDTHYCSVDIGFFYFISSTSLVLLTLLGSFIYHLLRWQVVYAYYLFQAYLYDTKRRNVRVIHQYDAFVSYNGHDEPWVLRELLPELEGNQGWKLCLHHRDFQPGKPIVDNITDAIYGSRKTICVISRRYLESEWCSREIQVASFRLFDEQKDVLILVFLEEVPDQQLSPFHRMRKLVKRHTYLSWPRAGEHTGVFWQKLRVALETRDCLAEENPILSGVDRK